jgi:pimeloyl-ACP methyl ester carboxylesterase
MVRQSIGHRGRRISYLEAPGAGSTSRSLVLLHAFPLCAAMWEPQLASVVPGWRVIAPDLRGFGGSDGGEASAVSIDDYGEDVLGLLDALGLDRAAVAGLSMGGYAAFSMLRQQPERVEALVLADTRAEADSEAGRAARDAMMATLAAGGPAAVFDAMQGGLLGETTRTSRPAVVERVRALAVAQPAAAIRRAIERLKGRPDSTPLLAAISCPTLVLVGAEDRITTPEAARQLSASIRGSSLSVIPEAGHLSSLEQPEAFNQALGGFLNDL